MEHYSQKDDRGEMSDACERNETPRARKTRWKRCAMYSGWVTVGGAVVAGAAVGVTLAASRGEAQRENLIAYLRGQVDGLKQGGWLDGWAAAEQWYAEHGVEELVEALAYE